MPTKKPTSPSAGAAAGRTVTLTNTVTSQQYSTNLQYNPYDSGYGNDYYSNGHTTTNYTSYQQYDAYGYSTNAPRANTSNDSFYARQLATTSYDSYYTKPRPNTNNDSYYARQIANEYQQNVDYVPASEWGYDDYNSNYRTAPTPPAINNRNGAKHQSLPHTNQSYLMTGQYDDMGGYSYGHTSAAAGRATSVQYTSSGVVSQQPGPPKKSVAISEPVRESSAPSTSTSTAAAATTATTTSAGKKASKKKSSNLGFSKSFYAGDESFYAVEQDHED